jgi:protein SCO1
MKVVLVILALVVPVRQSIAAVGSGDFAQFAFLPHPGAELPLPLDLTDEKGRMVSLGQFFTGKPLVVVLEYLRCKTLCGMTLENLVSVLDRLPLEAGRDFDVVAISIDPRDAVPELAAARAKYLAAYHHPGGDAAWHFLTGPEAVVRRIADSIGFPYRYDPELDQYMHPAGFIVAAPDGRISSYLLGVVAQPAEVERALAEAAQGKTVGLLTRLLLLCHGDTPQLGRYSLAIDATLIIANLGAMIGAAVVFAAIRRRRHG